MIRIKGRSGAHSSASFFPLLLFHRFEIPSLIRAIGRCLSTEYSLKKKYKWTVVAYFQCFDLNAGYREASHVEGASSYNTNDFGRFVTLIHKTWFSWKSWLIFVRVMTLASMTCMSLYHKTHVRIRQREETLSWPSLLFYNNHLCSLCLSFPMIKKVIIPLLPTHFKSLNKDQNSYHEHHIEL